MKRIVLCILAVMMLIFAFGCQKKEAEPEPTATPEPDARTDASNNPRGNSRACFRYDGNGSG